MPVLPLTSSENAPERPPLVLSILQNKCSRCRRGHMFKDPNPYHLRHVLDMNDHCPVCGQPLDIEVGFYFGTSYVSYALSIAVSAATFVAWWVLVGISAEDNRIFYWLGLNILLLVLLQPVFMRWARAAWLAFFVHYDPQWPTNPPKPLERVNESLKDAW